MHVHSQPRRFAGVLALALAAATAVAHPVSAATKKRTTTTRQPMKATTTPHTFRAEVWADNWFAMFVGDTKVGEDSVPITTERSFNAETFTFEASYPLQLRVIAKDFKENDTGLEYIGTDRQQMGDGGLIAQITDLATGKVVAATDASWKGLVVHAAPLNTDCEKSASPHQACTSRMLPEPSGWKSPSFDDSGWTNASTYSADQVGVKGGYNDIAWSTQAKLIWTKDLHVDNTILWRRTIVAPIKGSIAAPTATPIPALA